jgi:hypothetical protein
LLTSLLNIWIELRLETQLLLHTRHRMLAEDMLEIEDLA